LNQRYDAESNHWPQAFLYWLLAALFLFLYYCPPGEKI
jgi:hypothetical protein